MTPVGGVARGHAELQLFCVLLSPLLSAVGAAAAQHDACHSTLEAPPFRPPHAMLAMLASEVLAGQDVVDLRPTIDAAGCYSHRARSVQALVHPNHNATVCEQLEDHVRAERSRHHDQQQHTIMSARLNYTALCGRDFRARPADVPDGDLFLWWQQQRYWDHGAILGILRDRVSQGAIRRSANAIIMFDMTQWRDAGQWQGMKGQATWWHETAFDEREACRTLLPTERPQSICAGRACGTWLAARFPLVVLDDTQMKEWRKTLTDQSHGVRRIPRPAYGTVALV